MQFTHRLQNPYFLCWLSCLALSFLPGLSSGSALIGVYIASVLLGGVLFAAIFLKRSQKLDDEKIALLLFVCAFILRALYISYLPYNAIQHDLGQLTGKGHLGYIKWFCDNVFSLPVFQGIPQGQFYHPPLNHFVAGLWLKLNSLLGIAPRRALENLQILPLFYSSCLSITAYKILKEFSLQGYSLLIPFSLICFHPTALIMSGYLNNDGLCLMWMVITLFALIRWYKSPTTKHILYVALAFSLTVLSKSSGLLLGPAIAFVFLSKLFQERKSPLRLIKQYLLFLVVAIPLALSWLTYNYEAHGMPFNYVPRGGLSKNSFAYIGNYPLTKRFFDVDLQKLNDPFVIREPSEYCIPVALLKTAVFGEFRLFDKKYSAGIAASRILLYCNIVLSAISLYCVVKLLFGEKRKNPDFVLRVFCFLLYATLLSSFVIFCFQWPHWYTQNYRYVALNFVIEAIALGIALKNTSSGSLIDRSFHSLAGASAIMFSIFSVIVYCLFVLTAL